MRWLFRKRTNEFEWREYVRTTILVRRNERRQKVEDAKQAAIFGVKQAGHKGAEAGAAGLEAAGRAGKAAAGAVGRGGAALGGAAGRGAAAAGSAIAQGALSAARASRNGLYAGGSALGRAGAAGWRGLGSAAAPHLSRAKGHALDRLEPAVQALLRPSIAVPLTVIAIAAGAGSLFRWGYVGFDREVMIAGIIAIIAAILTLVPRAAVGDLPRPLTAAGHALSALSGDRLSSGATVAAIAAMLLVVGGGYWYWSAPAGSIQTAAISGSRDRAADDDVPKVDVQRLPDLKGRGSAVAGDLVKIGSTTVKLAGIEAPERNQRCTGPADRTWRCGDAAREALARLVRSKPVVCQLAGTDDNGFRLATCASGDVDIAGELVRGGHVFATTGFFAKYGSVESDARSARAGVWQGDAVERPSEYRAKRWEEAKRDAPQGCPIKGSVARGSRTYVLPWAPSYERVRVRENRGERWFCSEQEARAAGWRPTTL